MKKSRKLLRVRDHMSVDCFSVAPDDPLQRAVDFLRGRDLRSLPVVQDGRLIGIVTDGDLRQVAPSYPVFRDPDEIRQYLANLRVSAAMTADPLVVSPDTPLVEAAKLLETYRIRSLPVLEGAHLAGMISVTDILRVFIDQNDAAKTEKNILPRSS